MSNHNSEKKSKFKGKAKKIIPLLVLILVVAAIVVFVQSQPHGRLVGELEADIVPNVSEVPGKIVEIYFAPGQEVKEGDVLAVIDSTDQQYALEQLQITLKQGILQQGEAKGGSGTTTGNALLAAQSAYNSASAVAAQARDNYERLLELFQQGALPESDLEKAELAVETAANAETAARAQLNTAGNSYAEENAGLAVSKVQSQVAQAQAKLDQYTIRASCSGIVTSRNYTKGTVVAPGYDIADVANTAERYLVIYLPEERMGDYNFGQTMTVEYDKKKYDGVIKYIDVKTGYAPKDQQTAANRSKETVKVKLLLPGDCPMKAGERAEVLL